MITWEEAVHRAEKHVHRKGEGVSCSKLPYLEKCGGFVNDDEPSEAAFRGQCIHEYMYANLEDMIKASEGPFGLNLDVPLEEKYQIEAFVENIAKLMREGWRVVMKEEYRQNAFICGTADVILEHGAGVSLRRMVLDYKTGFIPVPADSPQLCGYRCLFQAQEACVLQGNTMSRDMSPDPQERVMDVLLNKELGTGSHCAYCAKAPTCQALRDMIESAPQVDTNPAFWAEVGTVLEKTVKKAKAIMAKDIDKYAGFKLQERKTKKITDVARLMDVIQVPASCLSVSMPKLEKEGIEIPEDMYEVTVTTFVTKDRKSK